MKSVFPIPLALILTMDWISMAFFKTLKALYMELIIHSQHILSGGGGKMHV